MTSTGTALLTQAGVSLWLDDLSRERLTDGSLSALTESHHIVGVTTNPTIFANSIGNSDAYDEQIRVCVDEGLDVSETITALTTTDVQLACDLFANVHEKSDGKNGWVSLEVEPELARDTDATVKRALQLAAHVDRANLMVKIPATVEGLPAISAVIAAGVSVNVTLIFSLRRYREVLNAFYTGIEQARAGGRDLSRIHSVASFFISRVDTAVDPVVERELSDRADELRGRFGIANASAAYEIYEQTLTTERVKSLESFGANRQRLLWASTGVKDARLSPTWYVEHLVAPNTVNTLPEPTLLAAQHLSEVQPDVLQRTALHAPLTVNELQSVGLNYDEVAATLETEGLEKFSDSWNDLTASVATRMSRISQ